VGLWRTTFVANLVVAALFSLLWPLGGKPVQMDLLWQPAVIAVCLFGGQLMGFLAFEKGDVSVAVPVFGLKVVLVAMLVPWVIGESVAPKIWIAASFSVLGVIFLNRSDGRTESNKFAITIAIAGSSAVFFALFDVLVQKWAPAWGAGRLLPLIFWINAGFSFVLIPMFKAPLSAVPRGAWPWLLMGAALLGTQSIIFVSTIAVIGKAAVANVVYASRGLLSVASVWLIGHWFSNQEQHLGARVMRWRIAGATLMLAAIVLVIA
jgi:drug/metabolite transporter (DMT)-like permease